MQLLATLQPLLPALAVTGILLAGSWAGLWLYVLAVVLLQRLRHRHHP